MRLYTFTNMYLSPIQRGIQSAHVTHDLFVKYNEHIDFEMNNILFDWAKNHKTMIVLNGGYSSTLFELIDLFDDPRNPYPFEKFHEAEESLGGALTCVGIVLPEKIYEMSAMIRSDPALLEDLLINGSYTAEDLTVWTYNGFEIKLIQELNNYGLA